MSIDLQSMPMFYRNHCVFLEKKRVSISEFPCKPLHRDRLPSALNTQLWIGRRGKRTKTNPPRHISNNKDDPAQVPHVGQGLVKWPLMSLWHPFLWASSDLETTPQGKMPSIHNPAKPYKKDNFNMQLWFWASWLEQVQAQLSSLQKLAMGKHALVTVSEFLPPFTLIQIKGEFALGGLILRHV